MNYLTFIDNIEKYNRTVIPLNFLVSGSDPVVRNTVLNDVCIRARQDNRFLLIIDDTKDNDLLNSGWLTSAGYRAADGFNKRSRLYNPFNINTIKGMSRLRQLLDTLEYDEKRKMKLIAYFNFIQHIEYLRGAEKGMELTISKFGEYSSSVFVEMKIQNLVDTNIIDESQQIYLISKYSEVCDAAADFEDMLYLFEPFITDNGKALENDNSNAAVYKIGELGSDDVIKAILIQLLLFSLEDLVSENITVILLDKGFGHRKYIFDFLTALPKEINIHIFSEDIFTLCDQVGLQMILNRFPARVYSRHSAMNSCSAIEQSCGEVDVVKHTYTVNYDRRRKANRPWDVLMGNNKTEVYGTNAPVREPKYRKEMIAGFPPGNGIVEYMGNSSVFSL